MTKIANNQNLSLEQYPATNWRQGLIGLRQALTGFWHGSPKLNAAQQYDIGMAEVRPPRPVSAHQQIARHGASLAAMLNRNI